MSLSRNTAPRRAWLEWLGLGSAGVLSFVVAAWLGGWGRGAASDDSLVLPVERAAMTIVVRPDATPAPAPAQSAAIPNTSGLTTNRAPRMEPHVLHDPFGALNLAATADPEPTPSIALSSVARQRRVTPVKLVPPPAPVTAALPATSPEPPAPVAPPLPFTAVGAIRGVQIADGQPVVFLKQHDDVLAVRVGDAVNQVYQVERITAERIDFIYLPLKQRQTLSLAP